MLMRKMNGEDSARSGEGVINKPNGGRVKIKTNRFDFCGIRAGDTGIILQTRKNYYGEPVFEIRVNNKTIIFSEDEIEEE